MSVSIHAVGAGVGLYVVGFGEGPVGRGEGPVGWYVGCSVGEHLLHIVQSHP